MPTTVVQNAARTFEDEGYPSRLRRPTFLEGLRGLGAAPCASGYTFRQSGGRCFCDPELQGFGGLGEEIPCPTTAPRTTIYKAPPVVTTVMPAPAPELVITNDEQEAVVPNGELPEGQIIPVRKQVPPWVWYASGGTAAAVVGWLFFRRKKR
jgi:hypothetical protein